MISVQSGTGVGVGVLVGVGVNVGTEEVGVGEAAQVDKVTSSMNMEVIPLVPSLYVPN